MTLSLCPHDPQSLSSWPTVVSVLVTLSLCPHDPQFLSLWPSASVLMTLSLCPHNPQFLSSWPSVSVLMTLSFCPHDPQSLSSWPSVPVLMTLSLCPYDRYEPLFLLPWSSVSLSSHQLFIRSSWKKTFTFLLFVTSAWKFRHFYVSHVITVRMNLCASLTLARQLCVSLRSLVRVFIANALGK